MSHFLTASISVLCQLDEFNLYYEDEELSFFIKVIFSLLPAKIAKNLMSIFFILRVHFVFARSKLKIKPLHLYAMLSLPVISTILSSIAGIGGPLHVFGEHDFTIPSRLGFSGAVINIFTDIWVTVLYAERLVRVVMMQSEVMYCRVSACPFWWGLLVANWQIG